MRLYWILTINAFEIPNAGEASLASVYATGCLPEHNCVPSCHRSFGQDLSITLRAAIPLGELYLFEFIVDRLPLHFSNFGQLVNCFLPTLYEITLSGHKLSLDSR